MQKSYQSGGTFFVRTGGISGHLLLRLDTISGRVVFADAQTENNHLT